MAKKLHFQSEKKVLFKGTQFVIGTNQKIPIVKRVVWAGKSREEFLKYGRSAKISLPVSQILNSKSAHHLINQLHFKIPGDGVSFPWHTDLQNRMAFDKNWKDVNGNGCYVVAITALDKITKENAPLFVLPGSHLLKDLNFSRFSKTESLPQILNAAESRVSLLMDRGDTVFIHPKLVHGSWENNSENERKVFINGFSYPGANHAEYPG
jgi:phytanoyl-CoA hydroxylase